MVLEVVEGRRNPMRMQMGCLSDVQSSRKARVRMYDDGQEDDDIRMGLVIREFGRYHYILRCYKFRLLCYLCPAYAPFHSFLIRRTFQSQQSPSPISNRLLFWFRSVKFFSLSTNRF